MVRNGKTMDSKTSCGEEEKGEGKAGREWKGVKGSEEGTILPAGHRRFATACKRIFVPTLGTVSPSCSPPPPARSPLPARPWAASVSQENPARRAVHYSSVLAATFSSLPSSTYLPDCIGAGTRLSDSSSCCYSQEQTRRALTYRSYVCVACVGVRCTYVRAWKRYRVTGPLGRSEHLPCCTRRRTHARAIILDGGKSPRTNSLSHGLSCVSLLNFFSFSRAYSLSSALRKMRPARAFVRTREILICPTYRVRIQITVHVCQSTSSCVSLRCMFAMFVCVWVLRTCYNGRRLWHQETSRDSPTWTPRAATRIENEPRVYLPEICLPLLCAQIPMNLNVRTNRLETLRYILMNFFVFHSHFVTSTHARSYELLYFHRVTFETYQVSFSNFDFLCACPFRISNSWRSFTIFVIFHYNDHWMSHGFYILGFTPRASRQRCKPQGH